MMTRISSGERRQNSALLDRRSHVIEVPLTEAILRFELRFEGRTGGGTVITQRVSISGANAAEHREGLEAGFGQNMRVGMLRIAKELDEAAARE